MRSFLKTTLTKTNDEQKHEGYLRYNSYWRLKLILKTDIFISDSSPIDLLHLESCDTSFVTTVMTATTFAAQA